MPKCTAPLKRTLNAKSETVSLLMKLDVFGKLVEVNRRNEQWLVFYVGNEGKKRMATDISVPNSIPESEVINYIADLCHEWATSNNPSVTQL